MAKGKYPERQPLDERFPSWIQEIMDRDVKGWRDMGSKQLTAAATVVGTAYLSRILDTLVPGSNSIRERTDEH